MLLKNGRRIENVKIKPVANGFEISHPNGKIESIPLSKVLKIFVSDDVPKSARILEPNSKTEIINKEASSSNNLSETKPKKSGVAVFSEGLIPGWSRMARSDSYSVKGLGFFFILAELFLVHKNYLYLNSVESLDKSRHPIMPPPYVFLALASGSTNLLLTALVNNSYSESHKIRLTNGQILQKGRYEQEKEAYLSAFVFVLLMDAFFGYKFEDWTFVPKMNVSVQTKEISAGVAIRF
ncbi:DNA-binding protein [Leptospira tipperaryensis]|uniref:DNA-binding protein n=1 Tax=Leptospira tipperaryensis TaxID=2564040 RepID=A0A1D7V2N7_9LEPT|nr:DNA-binding protein [Leptospira tipperaryensis]